MKPPKGWRWLRKGAIIKRGDKLRATKECEFALAQMSIGVHVYDSHYYIRRITKRKPTKRKGK